MRALIRLLFVAVHALAWAHWCWRRLKDRLRKGNP